MTSSTCRISLLPVLAVMSLHAGAQSFSYDGNRWYEIEVSIFSNESRFNNEELVIPEKTRLEYPQEIRQLESASEDFLIDFSPPVQSSSLPPPSPFASPPTAAEPEIDQYGPAEKPDGNNFILTDFNRDPFIALGTDETEFQRLNRDIANSPDHRLLYHAVWRQPVLNQVQSTAVFVDGGDRSGEHRELEGSLRFSYNVNRVDVEARLWFSRLAIRAFQSGQWQLPERPFPLIEEGQNLQQTGNGFGFGGNGSSRVIELGFMDQVRSMTSNTLHYLDHPDIGLLVEIRPYELPQPSGFSFE